MDHHEETFVVRQLRFPIFWKKGMPCEIYHVNMKHLGFILSSDLWLMVLYCACLNVNWKHILINKAYCNTLQST